MDGKFCDDDTTYRVRHRHQVVRIQKVSHIAKFHLFTIKVSHIANLVCKIS